MALLPHGLIPDHDIVVAYYRGYRPSSGRPSAAKIMADALTVHDRLVGPPGVIAVGFSIGSGIAAHLAAQRSLAGLVLVTPFDSLTALARHHYPWVPVRLLLRHRIETAELLRGAAAPTAVITAERTPSFPRHTHGRSSKQPGTWCTARSFLARDTTISMTHPNSPL